MLQLMLKLSSPRKIPTGTLMVTKATNGLNDTRRYHSLLLGSMTEEGEKAMKMSKTSEVLQGPDESPSQFYEHICEAIHFTPPLT
jgi:hypothetical protein